jgi:hypothetical protein
MDNDEIPTIGTYRGVPLEDQQSDARLALVRAEIDRVLGMTDARDLAGWAADSWHSPESRQLAVAMCETMWTVASETRANRPPIDLARLRASTAGLGSRRWRSPWHFSSLLDPDGGIERDRPLDDAEKRTTAAKKPENDDPSILEP